MKQIDFSQLFSMLILLVASVKLNSNRNKMTTLISVVFIGFGSTAQNLVTNPSFEIYDTCPYKVSQLYQAHGWFSPTLATPDYFNICADSTSDIFIPGNYFGYQKPRTGNAYAGLFLVFFEPGFNKNVYREYIETKLASPLKTGTKYYVKFFLSFADSGIHATSRIGAYFSKDSLYNDTSFRFINVKPQIENSKGNFLNDPINWVPFSGAFVANGAESFLTIGNFHDSLDSDTMLNTNRLNRPGSITFYQDGYYYIDDICVSEDSMECQGNVGLIEIDNNNEVLVNPNPASNNIVISSKLKISSIYVFTVYGDLVYRLKSEENTLENKLDVGNLEEGSYYVRVEINDKFYFKKFVVHK